jgi:hypothetical protein
LNINIDFSNESIADIAMQVPLWQQAALIKLSRYGSADEEQKLFLQRKKTKQKTKQIMTYDTIQSQQNQTTVYGEMLMG